MKVCTENYENRKGLFLLLTHLFLLFSQMLSLTGHSLVFLSLCYCLFVLISCQSNVAFLLLLKLFFTKIPILYINVCKTKKNIKRGSRWSWRILQTPLEFLKKNSTFVLNLAYANFTRDFNNTVTWTWAAVILTPGKSSSAMLSINGQNNINQLK